VSHQWSVCLLVGAMAAIGCGGPANSVSGAVAGTSLIGREATLYEGQYINASGATDGWFDGVYIDDEMALCPTLQALRAPGNWTLLNLAIPKDDRASVTQVRTYKIGRFPIAHEVSAWFGRTDSQCMTQLRLEADAGTVTVENATADVVEGSLDVLFGADRITGHFRAVRCVFDEDAVPACGG
jgi:hypothetical protein